MTSPASTMRFHPVFRRNRGSRLSSRASACRCSSRILRWTARRKPTPGSAFEKKFVGGLSDDAFMTLEDWKNRTIPEHSGDLLLQMDTEGAEYETLLSAPAALLEQFRIMVIEFHFLQELWNRRFFDVTSPRISQAVIGA